MKWFGWYVQFIFKDRNFFKQNCPALESAQHILKIFSPKIFHDDLHKYKCEN